MAFTRQENTFANTEPIALIGIGCRLPGNITSTDDLLEALRGKRDLITDVPSNRWNTDAFYDPDPLAPGKSYVRKGGFVENIESFDPAFFGISDAEASRMDPQQRLILQTIWHAIEDAGQPASELAQSNTGMFLAMMNTNGYSQLKAIYEGAVGITGYDAMGDAMSIAAGRVSHFLGLEGPCLSLDTACSSSLVALHLARQAILSGDCDTAIVVGVNVMLHPGLHIAFSKVGLMSRIGRCATFDASADGYIRGEGCVAVILRRQSLAIARGDHIHASIVGTAINQDGHTPALTAPNGRAQEKVIRSALARMGISPNDIRYLEAHGTGTPVGDPIEMSAIVNVFGPGRPSSEPLYVGSVKSNFGHIEAGAGLLGLAKAALSLEYEEILPNIHFTQLNPAINLGRAPIQVATRRVPWQRSETPRLAGINSFGYSGTNAHAILQEAPVSSTSHSPEIDEAGIMDAETGMLLISAKSAGSLEELVDKWIDFLDKDNTPSLRDIAYSAALNRSQLTFRLAIVGKGKLEIKNKLQSWRMGRTPQGLASGQTVSRIKPKIAFMFTGQGAQYAQMGLALYTQEPRFARTINDLAALMDPEMGAPLLEVLFGSTGKSSAEYLENTRYVQPALFAIEYALADLLGSWGIKPDFVIGHSVGEIVAAVIAGVLDLDDAARFVIARGRLMGDLPSGGKMLAISASVDQVNKWLVGREAEVSIAAVNGPRAVVISGLAEAVMAIDELAQSAGRQTKELQVSHAFHSPLMDSILGELTEVASSMHIHPAKIPIASNTTGEFYAVDGQPERIPSASYWSRHVRQAVLFHQGMHNIIDAGCSLIVEIGPHPALMPAVVTAFEAPFLHTISTLKKDKNDVTNMLASLAELHVNGASIKLDTLFSSPTYQRIRMPLYPFRREKYWLIPNGSLDVGPVDNSSTLHLDSSTPIPELPKLHPILGKVITHTSKKTVFETSIKTASPWADHRVLESTIFPGMAYLEMAARGFAAASGTDWCPVEIKDIVFELPLKLSYKEEKKVVLSLDFGSSGRGVANFKISCENSNHCKGRIIALKNSLEIKVDLKTELTEKTTEMKIGPFYGEMRVGGLDFGARFANVRELWLGRPGSGEAFSRVALSPAVPDDDPYNNAILMDSCQHAIGAATHVLGEKSIAPSGSTAGAVVPSSIQSITLRALLPRETWSHVRITTQKDSSRTIFATIHVFDKDGKVLMEIENQELRYITLLSTDKGTSASTKSTTKDSENQFFKSRQDLVGILRPLAHKERVSLISKWLTSEIKETLGHAAEGLSLDRLPPSTAFLEIGLDSLLVTELQRRIQEKLLFRFKPMQGLDYQSIESLAEYIISDVLLADLQTEAAAAD